MRSCVANSHRSDRMNPVPCSPCLTVLQANRIRKNSIKSCVAEQGREQHVSLTKIRKIRLLEQLESSLCLVHCDRVVLDLILHLEPSLELKHRFLPCPRASHPPSQQWKGPTEWKWSYVRERLWQKTLSV
jgi:hypothetical protein